MKTALASGTGSACADACARDPWLLDHPVRVTWWGGQFASGRLPGGHLLLPLLQQAWADATGGAPPSEKGASYGSDLRLYAGIGGIPTLHYGPGDIRVAHGPQEYVDLDDVAATARALILLTLRRCGVR